MKLFAVAVLAYIAHSFAMPMAIQFIVPLLPPGMPLFPVSFTLSTAFVAIAAFLYARWARTGLDIAGSITVGVVFLAVPLMMYLLSWGVAFFENAVIAVEDLQTTVIPLFERVEGGDVTPLIQFAFAWMPYAAPFFIGPYLAGFFVKGQAVEEARIVL